MFWAFIQMFIVCNFGEILTNRFGEVDNTIYGCDWYEFPYEIQRVLPIIMMGAQQSVIIEGFANLTCSREAFKKVTDQRMKLKMNE